MNYSPYHYKDTNSFYCHSFQDPESSKVFSNPFERYELENIDQCYLTNIYQRPPTHEYPHMHHSESYVLLKCDECPKLFCSPEYLAMHKQNKHPKKEIIYIQVPTPSIKHRQTVHGKQDESNDSSSTVEESLSSSDQQSVHSNASITRKNWKCHICRQEYYSFKYLKNHLKKKHQSRNEKKQPNIPIVNKSVIDLKRHILVKLKKGMQTKLKRDNPNFEFRNLSDEYPINICNNFLNNFAFLDMCNFWVMSKIYTHQDCYCKTTEFYCTPILNIVDPENSENVIRFKCVIYQNFLRNCIYFVRFSIFCLQFPLLHRIVGGYYEEREIAGEKEYVRKPDFIRLLKYTRQFQVYDKFLMLKMIKSNYKLLFLNINDTFSNLTYFAFTVRFNKF
ncbi:hypothetical protein BpHYR1_016859 [Brachionus plicatilis]|uniref:C2H2-type domain-containing protein n=1 Tax=Brachionus plicatilis TaxID=10195 RepID=A0A3M7STX6_BRAPC|nr:hypothetical protein BpHYR1_016859 [Brachionus plicatilis]